MTPQSYAPGPIDSAAKEQLLQQLQEYIEEITKGSPPYIRGLEKLLPQMQEAGIDTQPYLDEIKKLYSTHIVRWGDYRHFSFVVTYCHPTPEEKKSWIEMSLGVWKKDRHYHISDSGDQPMLAEAKAAGVDIKEYLDAIKNLYETDERYKQDTSFFRMVIRYCDLTPEEKREGFERCLKGYDMTNQALEGDPSYIGYLLRDSIQAGIISASEAKNISQGIIDHYITKWGDDFIADWGNTMEIFEIGFENSFLDPKEYATYILAGIEFLREDGLKNRLTRIAETYGILPIEQQSSETDDTVRAAQLAEEIKKGE